MSMTIRTATFEDIPHLVDSMHQFHAESNYPLDRRWASASFSTLLNYNALGAAWLALQDTAPAGYVVLTTRFSMEYGGLIGSIDDLFIDPAHRRLGLARKLLRAVFDDCQRRNVQAVQVEVGADNEAAQALYRSFGLAPYSDGRQVLAIQLDDQFNSAGE